LLRFYHFMPFFTTPPGTWSLARMVSHRPLLQASVPLELWTLEQGISKPHESKNEKQVDKFCMQLAVADP
jgi:hypothetical protein